MEETELAIYEHGADAADEVAEELRNPGDGGVRARSGNGLAAAVVHGGISNYNGSGHSGR